MIKRQTFRIITALLTIALLCALLPLCAIADDLAIPDDARVLILRDRDMSAPAGSPGEVVTVRLPLSVNRDYLPNAQYTLQNTTISPQIPSAGGVTAWPFDESDEASLTRSLSEMAYDAATSVSFEFRINPNAQAGVYPVTFKVTAEVRRSDESGGGSETKNVAFTLGVDVTVTASADKPTRTEGLGSLQAVREDENRELFIPAVSPGQAVTLRVPVKNVGGMLTNVSITPISSGTADELPFTVIGEDPERTFFTWPQNETEELSWTFTVSPYVTAGEKTVEFRTVYTEDSVRAEGSFSTKVNVVNGYQSTEPFVVVSDYALYENGTPVGGFVAGHETELHLTLTNTSTSETAKDIQVSLDYANCRNLGTAPYQSNTHYIHSIQPGMSAETSLFIITSTDAPDCITALGVDVSYESSGSRSFYNREDLTVLVFQDPESVRTAYDPKAPENNELENPEILIFPSDAAALILLDTGAKAPSGAPGEIVTIQLPMAVNREYLPSERYVLRNISIVPDIPTEGNVTSWPFEIKDASLARKLQDMTYDSRADIYFDFCISQYAKKGVYPVNFKVNATVWRYDEVNGTTITEDVTFKLCVYVTVTENGSLSGVTTAFGCLQIAGENVSGSMSMPSVYPWQSVTLRVPVTNMGGKLTNVTVTPVVSGSLDDFPFVVNSTNLSKTYATWEPGETKELSWSLTVSPYATSGNKSIKFKTTYFENGAAAEGSFSTQMTVVYGYEPKALSVMVQGYELYVDGARVNGLVAGQEAELRLTVGNNSAGDTAKKILINLNFAGSPYLTLAPGASDSAYIDSIKPGGSAQVSLRIMAKPDAEAGTTMLGIGVYFESSSSVSGSANQNVMIPVSQKMELVAGTPSVYGKQVLNRETTVSLPLANMGRGKVLSVRVTLLDGLEESFPTFVGDILPGGNVTADVNATLTRAGAYRATLRVEYEDVAGNEYSMVVPVDLDVSDPAETTPTPQPEDPQRVPEPEKEPIPQFVWIAGGAGIALLILIIVLCIVFSRRAKKRSGSHESH